MTGVEKRSVGIAVWVLGAVMPAAKMSNEMADLLGIPLVVFYVVAALAGAGGAWLLAQTKPKLTLTLGALGGLGVWLTIPLYLAWRAMISERYLTLELALPCLAVVYPLLMLWRWLDARWA